MLEKKLQIPHSECVLTQEEILNDFRIGVRSRYTSILGRKEVLTGKAGFGIFGDGVELPQIVLAKVWKKGDFRGGYYRDQTLELASGNLTVVELFSQLYADPAIENEPSSGGRQMNAHFGTRMLDRAGQYKNLTLAKNTLSDISPTAGQMAHLLGAAYASKFYRNVQGIPKADHFSDHGNEVVYGSIGDASTSEGIFFETMNAAGVLQVPLVMSVWDNGYGISVPRELQTVNNSISAALSGYASQSALKGIYIYTVPAWNYLKLCEVYFEASAKARKEHKPVLIHVTDVTQPQGHSTSGSHERYKSKDRLEWEKEYCCLHQFKKWILENNVTTEKHLNELEEEEKKHVESARKEAWFLFTSPILKEAQQAISLLKSVAETAEKKMQIQKIISSLEGTISLHRKHIHAAIFKVILLLVNEDHPEKKALIHFYEKMLSQAQEWYESKLYSESPNSPLTVEKKPLIYPPEPEKVDGRVVLLQCFDEHFAKNPSLFVLGEDIGKLGDVNLVFEGLNAKYGDLRVTDTGIREATILGQGIGAALRGLRPIVDIQYLDYFLYALQVASDDLATLHYRTAGGQKAPVIIRSKGHRLEGVWHTGSPLGTLLNSLRGVYICVPRNMTQAAGMYNTLLLGDNPALVIEVLNGYRLKEFLPQNVSEFTIPLGCPEILCAGEHITIVTYGACCRIALEAAEELVQFAIFVEVIDVQTLLPFDLAGCIVQSLKKTGAVLFFDEDVPGGASAYMMQQTLERMKGYHFLDSMPRTLTAKENRTPYGRDGDYFCKPQVEHVVEACYSIMGEREPHKYRKLY